MNDRGPAFPRARAKLLYLHAVSKPPLECPRCKEISLEVGTCEPFAWQGKFDMQKWEASCNHCGLVGAGDTEAEAISNAA
jgi:hypothetical protein